MTCRGEKWGHNFIQGICLSCGDSQQGLTITHRGREYEEEKEDLGKRKIEYSFQELGLEMQKHFPKEQRGWMWSLFNPSASGGYTENQIRQAFRVCQEKGILDVKYLRGVLKNI